LGSSWRGTSREGAVSEENRRPRKRIVDLAQNLLGLVIVTWFGWYLWQRRDHLLGVLDVSVDDVALVAALTLANWTFTAAQSAVMYRAAGINMTFTENWLLTAGAGFGSYLPMMAGTVVRFHYMKSIHGLRYARSGSISWLRAIAVAISTAAFGLLGTAGLWLTGERSSVALGLLFFAMLVAPVLVLLVRVPERWLARLPRAKNLRDFFEGLSHLREQRKPGLWLLVWIALQQVSLAMRLGIAANATGQSPPLLLLCIMGPLGVFISFVSITPAALGLREAVLGYVTYATGSSFGSGMYMGALDRAVSLALITVFGGASLAYLWRRIRRAELSRAAATSHASGTRLPTRTGVG
jgi:uncharacterized membrane protein YbhN (UPF0104 family)